MPDYSDVAVLAVSKIYGASPISARMAWANAAAEVFPKSVAMQVKGCPRTTFLTLCASGVVKGIPVRQLCEIVRMPGTPKIA